MTKKPTAAKQKETTSSTLVRYAVKGIEEKKGNEIVCLNLKKNASSPCDYFVICEANSRTQVQAIAGSVEEYIKQETGSRPWHVEGLQNAEWVLMDYVDVVVHIFQPHIRQHFGLEDMWADAEIKDVTTPAPRSPKEKVKRKVATKTKVRIGARASKNEKAKEVPAKKLSKTKSSPKKKTAKKIVKPKKKST
ncbi:MAG: ribosome silencing factor [Bacteroidetes bacterium]|nr:ribosome silencing factor [Bacteroidota bacterium]